VEIKTNPDFVEVKAEAIHLETVIGPQDFVLFEDKGDSWVEEGDAVFVTKNQEIMRFFKRHLVGFSTKIVQVKLRVQGPPTEQGSKAQQTSYDRKNELSEDELESIDRNGLRVR